MTDQPTPERAAPENAASETAAPANAAPESAPLETAAPETSPPETAPLDIAAPTRDAHEGADSAGPEAGWYPDPSGAAPLRWWDGSAWVRATHHPTAASDVVWRPVPPSEAVPSAASPADGSDAPPSQRFPEFLPPLLAPSPERTAPVPAPYPDLFDGPAQSDEQRRRSRRGLLLALGGIALLVVVALVAVGVLLNAARSSTLDTAAIETDISGRLSQESGGDVTVTCPGSVALAAGSTFSCDATGGDGTHVTVVVTQADDQGNVTWRIGS